MYSPAQVKAIVIIPAVTGTLSAVASGSLIVMVLRSQTGLKVPLRRIFFGLCIYDIIYSLANALSSLPIPKEDAWIWGATGNVQSCLFQAFLLQFGLIGILFYNVSLSIYYVCTIRFRLSEKVFRARVEPYLHFLSNFLPFSSTIYLLASNKLGPAVNVCWIPITVNHRLAFSVFPYVACFLLVAINMTIIMCSFFTLTKKIKRWERNLRKSTNSFGSVTGLRNSKKDPIAFDVKAARKKAAKYVEETKKHTQHLSQSLKQPLDRPKNRIESRRMSLPSTMDITPISSSVRRASLLPIRNNNIALSTNSSPLDQPVLSSSFSNQSVVGPTPRTLRKSMARNKRRTEVMTQGLLYLFCFLISFIFPLLFRVLGEGENLFVILICARIFTPMQGILNIFVYCRPHVKALRKRHPQYSYLKALWLVLKTGGDNNSVGRTRSDRKKNLQGNVVFLQRLERGHVQRMMSIRQPSRQSSNDLSHLRFDDSDDSDDAIDTIDDNGNSQEKQHNINGPRRRSSMIIEESELDSLQK